MSEAWKDYNEIMRERRDRKELNRIVYAKSKLEEIGADFKYDKAQRCFLIAHGKSTVRLYPFTGWFTGKSVKDGRGVHNLIKQLKEEKHVGDRNK